MTTKQIGDQGEDAAAQYLERNGFRVLERNWKTRWCEIDIVAEKDGAVHFVEVKYRASNRQGDGLEYITDKKLQQMAFAAELWVANHRYSGDYVLDAIAAAGAHFEVTDFIEL